MPTKYIRAHGNKFEGVYYYESQNKQFDGKSDVCYVVTFKVAGRKVWEKVGWKSKGITDKIADAYRTKRLQAIQLGAPITTAKDRQREAEKRNRTIGEIGKLYFAAKKGELKGIVTDLNRYEKHIKPMFQRMRVSEINHQVVAELKQALAEKADGTKWNILELLRRLVNFGAKSGYCPALGFTLEMPKRDNERVEYLKPDEAERFFTVMSTWPNQEVCRMLQLAFYSGMRKGEIFALQDGSIDFNFCTIKLIGKKAKGGKTSVIPLNEAAKGIIAEQIKFRDQRHPGSAYLFPGKNGNIRNDCSAVDRLKAAANLPKAFRIFHGLRHHYAVMLANSGKFTLDLLAEMMTHKSTVMTKRYGQFLPETMQAAGNLAESILTKSRGSNK